jgi:DNA-binding NarL/FixJ family response regulator
MGTSVGQNGKTGLPKRVLAVRPGLRLGTSSHERFPGSGLHVRNAPSYAWEAGLPPSERGERTNVAANEISTRRLSVSRAVAILAEDDVLARRLRLALARSGPEHVVFAAGFDELFAPVDVIVYSGTPESADLRKATGAALIEVVPCTGPREIRQALARGARGVVAEADVETALGDTVRAVLSGQLVLPADAAGLIARPALSPREKQVLGLVVIGLSNSEIAAKLHLAEATVKSHLTSSFRKLGVRTRSEASLRILDPEAGLGLGILSLTGGPDEEDE